jgi:hypothetical protein
MIGGSSFPPVALAVLGLASCRTALDSPPPPPAAAAPTPTPAAPAAVPTEASPAPVAPAAAAEAVSFDASVKPLLTRTCTPCHVPGGRMYERMPFDHADVVLAHRDGILRRLKNPDDRQVLERWLATQPAPKT